MGHNGKFDADLQLWGNCLASGQQNTHPTMLSKIVTSNSIFIVVTP